MKDERYDTKERVERVFLSGSVRIHRFGESSNGDPLLQSIDQKRRRTRRAKNIILLSSIGAHRFLWFEFWLGFSLDPGPGERASKYLLFSPP